MSSYRLGVRCSPWVGLLLVCSMMLVASAAQAQSADVNCNGIARSSEGMCVDYVRNGNTCNPVVSNVYLRPCDDYVAAGPGQAARCSPFLAPDRDGDLLGESCDSCPDAYNPSQEDADSDGVGDACDAGDTDRDGIPDTADLCPLEDASGADANHDGCIDTVSGLASLVAASALPAGTQRSLGSKVQAALTASGNGNRNAAEGSLQAFINEVNAQSGKKIPGDLASLLVAFAQNALAFL